MTSTTIAATNDQLAPIPPPDRTPTSHAARMMSAPHATIRSFAFSFFQNSWIAGGMFLPPSTDAWRTSGARARGSVPFDPTLGKASATFGLGESREILGRVDVDER